MAVTFIRTLIIFITLVIIMRLMGKRQIGEMQPFEFIITLIIADLACVPMADVSIPLVYGIVAILGLFVLHQVFSFLEQKGVFLKKVVSGKPSIVIDKNGVNMAELKNNNMDVDDLIESMRGMGYFSLDDLIYAIYESNGKLSTLESANGKGKELSVLIIQGGKIVKDNLKQIGKNSVEIIGYLTSKNYVLESVEVMTVDGEGKVYIKEKGKRYQIEKMELNGIKW